MNVDEILARIRALESGGNYGAANPHSSARGAYQFINSTWRSLTQRYGIGTQYSQAHLAPPHIQDEVARRYVQSILDSHNGDVRAVPAIWYTGRYNPNNLDYVPAPGAGNRFTVRQYIDKWFGGAAPSGGGGGGGGGGGQSFTQGGAPMTREQLAQRVRDQYPGWAWLLNEPEVGNLLLEAVDPNRGFDEATLKARLYATRWWRSHSEAMRTWDTLVQTDPATAESRVQQTAELVQQRARVLGVTIEFKVAREIAQQSLRMGWTGDFAASKIDRMLIDGYRHTGAGLIGSTEDEIRAVARSFLIPMSDKDAKALSVKIARGDDTIEGVRARFSDQAKALYPTLRATIESGATVEDFISPYRQVAAQLLEVSSDAIDFLDPKYLAALNGNGGVPLSLSDWQNRIRKDRAYGWHKTKQGRQSAYEISAELARRMGAIA